MSRALELCKLGDELRRSGKPAEAIIAYREAIALRPDFVEAHINLGIALRYVGQFEESARIHQVAVGLRPDDAQAWNNLGIAFSALENHSAAAIAYRRAIMLRQEYPQAHHNLGKALAELDRFEEAIAALRQAVALKADFAAALGDLSNALKHEGQLDEAFDCARRAVEAAPDSARAHCRLALMRLRRGDLEGGWAEYEWRYRIDTPWKFPQPRWDGSDLGNRTLLLHADQGLGDTVQFIRFAPLIAARGGRVLLRCQRQLKRLLGNFPGVAETCSEDDPLPQFDVHCPLISLPVAMRTNLGNIPAGTPYLCAPAAVQRTWRARVQSDERRLKVGLVWAGHPSHSNDRLRSMKLENFAPLADCADIDFFSLQLGPGSTESRQPPAGLRLIDETAHVEDFADTAGLIEQLDLIVAVDTSTAHVAAAMGKPVWVLLPYVAEWRWMIGRADTPWYPTMRLFRQPKLHDWDGAVRAVREALKELLAHRADAARL
jgi:tetratricopeptide (TPR) repeat protein